MREIPHVHTTAMTSIKSTYRSELPLPPSCVAFFPLDPKYFVVGTYYLERNEDQGEEDTSAENESRQEPKSQSRHGTLIVNEIRGDEM